MKFVLFYGSFGYPGEHWFPPLKQSLVRLHQEAIVPKFPCENWDDVTTLGPSGKLNYQSLGSWFEAFEPVYKSITKTEKLCFVGHSLGPVFILHIIEKYNLHLDSAVFVSPFLNRLNKYWQADKVNNSF